MRVVDWNGEKFTKTPYFWISRYFKIIDVGTPRKLVSSACYEKRNYVSICNRCHARLVDISKNRAFWRGTQIWRPRTEDSLNLGGPNTLLSE